MKDVGSEAVGEIGSRKERRNNKENKVIDCFVCEQHSVRHVLLVEILSPKTYCM